MKRRRLLVIGALVGASGCLGQLQSDDPNGDENGDENGDDSNGDDPNGNETNGDDPNGNETNGDDPNGNGDDPEPSGPDFDVGGLDPAEVTIGEGDSFDVSATITNAGDEEGTQPIEVRVDGDALGSEEITLAPDAEQTVSFEGVDTSDLAAGEYTYGVYSEDNSATGTLTVEPDPEPWEGVDTIRILGNTGGWIGAEPEMIADVSNPTIVLFEGQEYEFTWENDDGGGHNLEVRDENDEVVNDYATEVESGLDVVQTLEIEASAEMDHYVCRPHAGLMNGNIVIED